MQAAIAGRGRKSHLIRGHGGGRFIYTGSVEAGCSNLKCFGYLLFAVAGVSSVTGIMLSIFGSTGFFSTPTFNNAALIGGVALLISALGLTVGAFAINRRLQAQEYQLSPRLPNDGYEEYQ